MRALLLSLLVGVALTSAQAGTLTDAQQAGVLRVGTPGDYAPFSVQTTDGAFKGADIVEAKRIADKLGLKIQFVKTTWSNLEADTRGNKFDIAVGGISINDARKKFADFTVPLVTDGKRPITRCEDKDKYTTLDALNQPEVRIVVNPGGTNDAFAKEHLTKANVTVFKDNTKIFAQIADDKADAMVTDGVEVDHQAFLHPGVLCAAEVTAPFTHGELGYLLQKDPDLKKAVNEVVTADIASGDWEQTLTTAEKQK